MIATRAREVATAVEEERFLILTDEIAQTWMNYKTNDLERWLKGMRRMNDKLQSMGGRDPLNLTFAMLLFKLTPSSPIMRH